MRKLRWKLNKEQDEHRFIFAVLPLFLTALLPYIGIESLKEVGTAALGVICCWMFISVCRRRKLIKLPKKLLNIWIGLNTIMSVAVIVLTIGTIFFRW